MSDIPGSKPKKLIRRTNFSNPSLISNSILCLFNPQNVFPAEQREKIKRSNSNMVERLKTPIKRNSSQFLYNPPADSLNRAEDEYLKKKLIFPSIHLNNYRSQNVIQNVQKLNDPPQRPGQAPRFSSRNDFNFQNFSSIKIKQRHGYDIINCLPSSQA